LVFLSERLYFGLVAPNQHHNRHPGVVLHFTSILGWCGPNYSQRQAKSCWFPTDIVRSIYSLLFPSSILTSPLLFVHNRAPPPTRLRAALRRLCVLVIMHDRIHATKTIHPKNGPPSLLSLPPVIRCQIYCDAGLICDSDIDFNGRLNAGSWPLRRPLRLTTRTLTTYS
jgi:hypothetical protein